MTKKAPSPTKTDVERITDTQKGKKHPESTDKGFIGRIENAYAKSKIVGDHKK